MDLYREFKKEWKDRPKGPNFFNFSFFFINIFLFLFTGKRAHIYTYITYKKTGIHRCISITQIQPLIQICTHINPHTYTQIYIQTNQKDMYKIQVIHAYTSETSWYSDEIIVYFPMIAILACYVYGVLY